MRPNRGLLQVFTVSLLSAWSLSVSPTSTAFASDDAASVELSAEQDAALDHDSSVNVIHTSELALSHGHSVAAPESNAPKPVARPRRQWYGWQTLSADGASFLLLGLGEATEQEALQGFAVGAYLLGAPAVHVGHGQWAKAGGSLGLRALVPLIGAGVYSVQDCTPSGEESTGWCDLGRNLLTGVVVVAVTATTSALDSALLGWEPREPEPSVVPLASVTPRSAWLGVGGRF